jgi:hypothetical protein
MLYYLSYVVRALTFSMKTGNVYKPTGTKNKISQQFYVDKSYQYTLFCAHGIKGA